MTEPLIEQYEAAGLKLRQAIAGLSPAQLLARPDDGSWSIQQIILHLMDSDLIWTDRAKRIIAEDNPTLIGYDQSRFAAGLAYDQQSADDAVTIFELNRRQFAKVLRRLEGAAWQRIGTHNERGPIRLREALASIVEHLEHHLAHLRAKRAKLEPASSRQQTPESSGLDD